jgi:Secretion system C-terminal sorting domain
MKKTVMIIVCSLLTTLSALGGNPLFPTFFLNGTNIKSLWINNGDLFYYSPVPSLFTGFETPVGSGKSSIYVAQLWVGGRDSASNSLMVSSQMYRASRSVWTAGPISSNSTGAIFEDVFPMYRGTANTHRDDYQNAGYTPSGLITGWPGNGNTGANELLDLAPFIDLNGNGLYEYNLGEYPLYLGKRNVFMVFNDQANNNTGPGLGIEVRGFAYEISEDGLGLEKTVFVNYELINRSQRTYEDFYTSLFVDFDLGNPMDDFTGCDPSRNAFFAYNGTNLDGSYGLDPPAVGVIFLNSPINSYIAFNNDAAPKNGNPTTDLDYYNFMRGLWKDGAAIKNSGDGTGSSGSDTKFLYSGNGWDEITAGNVSGDRRSVGSVGPLSLRPGERVCLDIAFVHYKKSGNDFVANRDDLLLEMDQIQQVWDSLQLGCFHSAIVGTDKLVEQPSSWSLFPNPAGDFLTLRGKTTGPLQIEVFDNMGKEVERKIWADYQDQKIDVSHLNSGTYFLRIIEKEKVQTIRFIKD